MPKNWVFSLSYECFFLSFEFFPTVLRFFLEFLLEFFVSVTAAKLVGYLNSNLPFHSLPFTSQHESSTMDRWIKTVFSEKIISFKKCRKFEFLAWAVVFSLSFEVFSPWVCLNVQNKILLTTTKEFAWNWMRSTLVT